MLRNICAKTDRWFIIINQFTNKANNLMKNPLTGKIGSTGEHRFNEFSCLLGY